MLDDTELNLEVRDMAHPLMSISMSRILELHSEKVEQSGMILIESIHEERETLFRYTLRYLKEYIKFFPSMDIVPEVPLFSRSKRV